MLLPVQRDRKAGRQIARVKRLADHGRDRCIPNSHTEPCGFARVRRQAQCRTIQRAALRLQDKAVACVKACGNPPCFGTTDHGRTATHANGIVLRPKAHAHLRPFGRQRAENPTGDLAGGCGGTQISGQCAGHRGASAKRRIGFGGHTAPICSGDGYAPQTKIPRPWFRRGQDHLRTRGTGLPRDEPIGEPIHHSTLQDAILGYAKGRRTTQAHRARNPRRIRSARTQAH